MTISGDTEQTPPRVQGLDLLRLFAVMGVVLYHYGFFGPTVDGVSLVALPYLTPFAKYGYLGVPAFFVISGFAIAFSAEGRTAAGFAIARFSRIYPTYVFCMTLTFVTLLTVGRSHFDANVTQWAANLFIAAPALHEHYMDAAYWSLVVEVTFYAWATALIAAGLFPRRIDAIVLTWLCISMANELTIDSSIMEKIFLADHSGFFATGILIYEHYRGRRDGMLYGILALSVGTAVFQSVHNLAWLRYNALTGFDDCIVAAICLASIGLIFLATRIQRLPLPAGLGLALGGLTYPLYLMHMQIGYAVVTWIAPAHAGFTVCVVLSSIAALSWAVWRYVEKPAHDWTKRYATKIARRLGWPSRLTSATA